ncbi:ribonuclease PH [Candidatus Sumerlaeota bacterium]|nr:ribonuclease PH [Candidatus Sumerlaeota bacterium]
MSPENPTPRVDGRRPDEQRPIRVTPDIAKFAGGSCLIEIGDTRVMCTATVDNQIPGWLRGQGRGWVTAEYAMLPCSTPQRTVRDANRRQPAARSTEIQRLIGRSLRAVTDLKKLGERQIVVDCDVLQADGGTRTASITGAFIAMVLAMRAEIAANRMSRILVTDFCAGTSVGIVEGRPVLDLNYLEDSQAETDMNVVMSGAGGLIEIQGTAETAPFSEGQLHEMLALAKIGIDQLIQIQKDVLQVDSFAR